MAHFADSLKRDSTRLKEIGTKDVLDWMFTTWLLNGLTSEYDSFRMMLTNNRKANQAKGEKTELEFDSILEQILSLDTQKKASEARSMKSASKPKERKKASPESLNLCPYCSKPGHPEEKCYYKHPERASEDFRLRFQSRIKELESKANATRAQSSKSEEEQGEANRIYVE